MMKLLRLLPILFLLAISCAKKDGGSSSEESSVDLATTEAVTRGELVYKQYCITCHMKDGGGAPPMNPPLINTSFVNGDKSILINIVLKGMSGEQVDGQRYHNVMPPLDFLTDEQIADVLTYVRNSFGNKADPVIPSDVTGLRKK